MRIYSLKRMSIPKIAVLATGLTAAVLAATISPMPAQAEPSFGVTCIGCHTAGGSVTATPSTTTPAAGAAYTVAIVLTNAGTGNSGYNISLAGASITTGGPAAGKTFSANMTAPAAVGTYTYNVGADTGAPPGAASATTYTITVGAAPTTVPPTTVPPTTVPPTTVPPTTVPPTTVPPTTVPPTTVPPTTVPPVITAPGHPTGVTAIPGNGLAVVSWTPSTTGDPATSYTVTASPGGRTVTTTGTSATVTGLTNGTSYTFTVTATNAIGTSPASAPSAAVTPAPASLGSFRLALRPPVRQRFSTVTDDVQAPGDGSPQGGSAGSNPVGAPSITAGQRKAARLLERSTTSAGGGTQRAHSEQPARQNRADLRRRLADR